MREDSQSHFLPAISFSILDEDGDDHPGPVNRLSGQGESVYQHPIRHGGKVNKRSTSG